MRVTFKSLLKDEWTVTVEPSKDWEGQVWMHVSMGIGATAFCLMDPEHAVSLGNAFLAAAEMATHKEAA
jgi:hypothetical protein